MLDLSKIEAGQLTLDLADYSLQDIVQTVYSAVEPLAADKKLTFRSEVAPDLPRGRGDERRLTQVLLNLVGNAIKFTDAGEVVIKVIASQWLIQRCRSVTPVRAYRHPIRPSCSRSFSRPTIRSPAKKGGTGLGLAISKRIIEMHGGKIWVDSAVGQGSVFTFTVPVRVDRQVEAS